MRGVRGARGVGQRTLGVPVRLDREARDRVAHFTPKNSRMAAATRSTVSDGISVCNGSVMISRVTRSVTLQIAAPAGLEEREILGGQEVDAGGDARGCAGDR